ncbi:hypothetical protein NQ314_017356 [Rhamnusium bicolor]|uniref:Uncharacterized protein n=1 Tax=Rhamnusium bicolor TaxID=1586634 RepID=A0AAV8WTW7_9CUCU|nr:hypothetical protein NQ314_017356 [Rhamnusium bicolor]
MYRTLVLDNFRSLIKQCCVNHIHVSNLMRNCEVYYKVRLKSTNPQVKLRDYDKINRTICKDLIHKDNVKMFQLEELKRTMIVLKRWEEEKKDDGVKWNFLEHKGPVFAPPYDRNSQRR